MRVHCHNIQTCCIQSQETLWPAGVSAQVSGFCKWTKSLFDDTTALFDEYCINCDLAFVDRLCLKIHNKSTRTRIVIHVISHLRPEYVSKYTLGCLREVFWAPCNICHLTFEAGVCLKIHSGTLGCLREVFWAPCNICELKL